MNTNAFKGLKQKRHDIGLTQHDLAKLSGIQCWRIAFAETGRIHLTAVEVQTIQKILEKRASEVLSNIAGA
jgi:predicted transcriptional regulator